EDFTRALDRRPRDPGFDERFHFGLEGIPLAKPRVVREPRRSGNTPQRFQSEFRQLHRVSTRLPDRLAVQVNFDGRWYMGQLTETNENGGLIVGVRAPATWRAARGALRPVDDCCGVGAVACAVHSIDEASGRLVVRFENAVAATRLIAALRGQGDE